MHPQNIVKKLNPPMLNLFKCIYISFKMNFGSTGIYGTIVTSDLYLYEDVEQLKTKVTTLSQVSSKKTWEEEETQMIK